MRITCLAVLAGVLAVGGWQREPPFAVAAASSGDAEVEFDVNADGSFSQKKSSSRKTKRSASKSAKKKQKTARSKKKPKTPAVVDGPNPFGRVVELDSRAANDLVFGFGGAKGRLHAAAMAEAARDGAIRAKSGTFGKEPYSTSLFPQPVGGEDDEDEGLEGVSVGGEDIVESLEAGTSDGTEAYPELKPARDTSQDPWVLMFYAPWCPHCKDFKGPLRRAAKRLQGAAHVATVDGTSSRELASRFGVGGYPSIFLLKNGSAWTYNRPRSADALTWWVKEGHAQDAPLPWAESPVGPVATAKSLVWAVIDTIAASTKPTADAIGVPEIGVQFAIVLSMVMGAVGGLVLCAVIEGGHCRRGGFKYEYEQEEWSEEQYLAAFEGGGSQERRKLLQEVRSAEEHRKDKATRRREANRVKRKVQVQSK